MAEVAPQINSPSSGTAHVFIYSSILVVFYKPSTCMGLA